MFAKQMWVKLSTNVLQIEQATNVQQSHKTLDNRACIASTQSKLIEFCGKTNRQGADSEWREVYQQLFDSLKFNLHRFPPLYFSFRLHKCNLIQSSENNHENINSKYTVK